MILTWLGAAAVGLCLGVLGSGGSIITVPVLIYLAGQPEKAAIAESLAIVGTIALTTGLVRLPSGRVRWRFVLLFGLPGMAGSYLGAQASAVVATAIQLTFFATVLFGAAYLLLRPAPDRSSQPGDPVILGFYGFGVGVLTGFVGVGGGFLIVPAMTLLGGLPIHNAIASSLWIIALTSGTGFWKYGTVLPELGLRVDWTIVAAFTAIGIGGALVGTRIADRLPQRRLQRAFAGFLVAVGVLVLGTSARAVWADVASRDDASLGPVPVTQRFPV